ncbi:MAG: hypothetical protein IKR48_07645 [Kiritimatiellae bacterium]|nr:hypothetical protein [Kiritimatiellia bacterium]
MQKRIFIFCLVLAQVTCCRAETILDVAKRDGKGMMVYAYGSDWSESGRTVHKLFRSAAFQNAVSSRYVLGEVDVRDVPTRESEATNRWAAPGNLESFRLPALFLCGKDGRGFLALENIPITATAPWLLSQVAKAERIKGEADKLIARANQAQGVEAAERIGEALSLLEPLLVDTDRLLGKKCQGTLFDQLKALDPKDATGWQRRFTMGNGVGLIAEVNAAREKKDFKGGEKILAREAAKCDRHLTLNQRQAVAMLPFSLYRKDEKRKKENIRLLDRVAAMGSETLWGMAAVGFLRSLQAPEAERYMKPMPKRQILRTPRMTEDAFGERGIDRTLEHYLKVLDWVTTEDLPHLSKTQRKALVCTYILLSAGKESISRISKREGGKQFLNAFLQDISWMESFAGSGPWHYGAASALDALDLLAWNEPGVYTNGFQRKAATAFSLNFPIGTNDVSPVRTQERLANQAKKNVGTEVSNEEAIVRTLQIFTELSKAGRLHDKVYGLDTYEWRYLLFPWDRNDPEDLLALNAFCNTSYDKTFRLGWKVPYRLRNCFGESVHRPEYYQPWIHAKSRYLVGTEIGGVCNLISSFAVTLGHAHGLMAVTAGQPYHCAFVTRPERGGAKQWQIRYYIQPYTMGRWGVFKWGRYQNLLAAEDLYEGTTLADREYPRWLADVRRFQSSDGTGEKYREDIANLYRIAMVKAHGNWPAGHDWQEYLRASKAPAEAWNAYADTVLETTFDRIPIVSELLKPYHDTLAARGDEKALDEAFKKMFRTIRLNGRKFPEMPDYRYVLNPLVERFGKKDPHRLFRLFGEALAAHDSMEDEFFQQTLAWGATRYLRSKEWETPFINLVLATLERMDRASSKGGKPSDAGKSVWRKQITAAEEAGAMERRDKLLSLFRRLYPPSPIPKAPSYPTEDFGGTLISSNACVQLSKVGRLDCAERHLEFCDASPSRADKEGPPVSAEVEKGTRGVVWIRLQLGGVSEVSGILLVNAKKTKQRKGQLPLRVEVSENGSDWKTVATITKDANSWRVPLSPTESRVKFVRAVRGGEGDEPLRLLKMLIYGRKLY